MSKFLTEALTRCSQYGADTPAAAAPAVTSEDYAKMQAVIGGPLTPDQANKIVLLGSEMGIMGVAVGGMVGFGVGAGLGAFFTWLFLRK